MKSSTSVLTSTSSVTKKCFILGSCFVLLGLASCKKDKDEPKDPKAILTTGKWKRVGLTVSPGYDYNNDGIKETDVLATWPECDKDDTWQYKADGTGIYDEGANNCNPQDGQTENFNWELKNNNQTFVIYGDAYKVEHIDNSMFRTSYQFTENGTTYTETITFVR